MELSEMKRWLMSDEEVCINWRHNPANQRQVSEMISALAASPGGYAASMLVQRLAEEKAQLDRALEERVKAGSLIARLKAHKREEALSMGIPEHEFERTWPEQLAKMAQEGSVMDHLAPYDARIRARSARTF